MYRALTCPSSGGKIVFTQHLVSSLSVNVCTVHWLRADCSKHVEDNSITNILLLNNENCALKLVDEIILYYDARSEKHQIMGQYVQIAGPSGRAVKGVGLRPLAC